MIFEVSEALAINREKGREIHFSLPHHPKVYDKDVINQNSRFVLEKINNLGSKAWIEIATPEQPLRAPSGGCLDRITDSRGDIFVALEQRDNIPKIRAPGFQNPSGLGYPNTIEECFQGDYLLREANEECFSARKFLPILGRKGAETVYVWEQALLVPESLPEKQYSLGTAKKLGLNFPQETLHARYEELGDSYYIHQGEKLKGEIINSSFSWWPTPDILLLREIFLPVTIREILLYHENRRETLVVNVEELRGKRFGDKMECIAMHDSEEGKRISEWAERVFKPTSSLKRILYQIGIYPNDWLEETRQLLSCKDYDQLWKEDPTRDPFVIENIIWEKGKHP